ncbi:MAG: hypothetical protein ACRDCN_13640 [Tannerellaceae bacterium]
MKDNYSKSIALRCIVCGGQDFEFNEDNSYFKCNLCNREYIGGYNELVELNKGTIFQEVEAFKTEVNKDISDILKTAFKENNIKIK